MNNFVAGNPAVLTPSVKNLKELLNHGFTRTPKCKNYEEGKSIMEFFNVSEKEVKSYFQHPKLKGLKTKQVPTFKFSLVDDEEDVEETVDAPVVLTTDEDTHENDIINDDNLF